MASRKLRPPPRLIPALAEDAAAERPEARFALRRAWRAAELAAAAEDALALQLQGQLGAVEQEIAAGSAQSDGLARLARSLCETAAAWQAQRHALAAALAGLQTTTTEIAEDCDRYAQRSWRQTGRLSKAMAERQERTAQLDEQARRLKSARTEAARANNAVQTLHRRLVRVTRLMQAASVPAAPPPPTRSGWLSRAKPAPVQPTVNAGAPWPAQPPAPPAWPEPLPITPAWRLPDGPEQRDLRAILPAPLPAGPGRWHATTARGRLPVLAVLALGLRGAALAKIVIEVTEEAAERRWCLPLFITDADDLAPLRAERYAFEFLPRPSATGADLDWPLYYARKAALIRNKWAPASTLVVGDPPPFDPAALCTGAALGG